MEENAYQRKRLETFFDEELIAWSKEIMQQYNTKGTTKDISKVLPLIKSL